MSGCPRFAASSASRARCIRPSTASSSTAAAATSIRRCSRSPTSIAPRSGSTPHETLRQPDDVPRDDLAGELVAIASNRIRAGEWPWSFFCYLEERSRPVTPSSFTLLAAGGPTVALAVCCPSLRLRLHQRRLPVARRRALRERRPDRGDCACVRSRRAADGRCVPPPAAFGRRSTSAAGARTMSGRVHWVEGWQPGTRTPDKQDHDGCRHPHRDEAIRVQSPAPSLPCTGIAGSGRVPARVRLKRHWGPSWRRS